MKEIFRQRREAAAAIEQAERVAALAQAVAAMRASDRSCDAYLETARCQEELSDYESALNTLREGIEKCAPSAELFRRYIWRLQQVNRAADAIEAAQEARRKFPSDFFFRLQESLLLPILYSNVDELERYRRRYTEGLSTIAAELDLGTPAARENALAGLSHRQLLLPAYQGLDDREIQTMYGEMAHRIVGANYPQWVQPLPMPPREGRLRIGYISGRWYNQSVAKTHLGWILAHQRDCFEVFVYHIGDQTDGWTEDARQAGSVFRHLPGDLEETCRAVLADRLHVLVFLDIGMDMRTIKFAALRLAPVQCTTWGHPVTSGLPTVDYYLSSELMEPADAQKYYTERLICLPGIGVYFRKPVIPTVCFYKSRADFGIREDAIMYLSCQSAFKYLPQHDDIYPAIAKEVPGAQFVFLERNAAIRNDFQKRLEAAFLQAGVPIEGRVVFVPRSDNFDYWNLNVLSDIFLDTMEWSGCNSTLEAIACRLPVVTLPGRFMRGRHSMAILMQAGVPETIARDKRDYVDIAVRLGLDGKWRKQVVQNLVAGYRNLYSDDRCVRALEDFYRKVAGENEINAKVS